VGDLSLRVVGSGGPGSARGQSVVRYAPASCGKEVVYTGKPTESS